LEKEKLSMNITAFGKRKNKFEIDNDKYCSRVAPTGRNPTYKLEEHKKFWFFREYCRVFYVSY
jgi:hypothetical protein